MDCPSCGSDKDWAQCATCGGICCDGCGYSDIGKRSGDKGCPYCEITGGEIETFTDLVPLIGSK